MRVLTINKKSGTCSVIDTRKLNQVKFDDNNLIWIDFKYENKASKRELLSTVFGISDLAIDDAQKDRHPPKYEKFSSYSFMLLKAFDANIYVRYQKNLSLKLNRSTNRCLKTSQTLRRFGL